MSSELESLREAISNHTCSHPVLGGDRNFELAQRDESTYEAVFAARWLPGIDYKHLGVVLSATPQIVCQDVETTLDNGMDSSGRYPIKASYMGGNFEGKPLSLHLWLVRKKMSHSLFEKICDAASEKDASYEGGPLRHRVPFSSCELL